MNLPVNLPLNMQNQITDLTSDIIQLQINEQFLGELLYTNDIVFLHKVLAKVRNVLSSNDVNNFAINMQIEETIIAQMIPYLIEIIEKKITISLTQDASWILVNITSGIELTQQLAKFGGIELFISLLESNNQSILELAVWALANFSKDVETLRPCLLKNNIIQKVIEIEPKFINKTKLILFIHNLTKSPLLPHNYLHAQSHLIPILTDYITKNAYEQQNTEQKQGFIDAIWSLCYISEHEQSKAKILKIPGILETVKQLMVWNDLTGPSLNLIGNIATEDEEQTQAIIDCGFLKSMLERFKVEADQNIKKLILWVLSNICAGSEQQIQAVLHESDMISVILNTIKYNEKYDVVTEALFIISNSFESISEADAQILIQNGVLELLQNFILYRQDQRQAEIILEGLYNLVYRGFESLQERLAEIFQKNKAWLQPLIFKYSLPIQGKTLNLIYFLNQKDHFDYEDDEEDEEDEDEENFENFENFENVENVEEYENHDDENDENDENDEQYEDHNYEQYEDHDDEEYGDHDDDEDYDDDYNDDY